KGHDVLAVDISPLAIKVCKLRGLRNVAVMSITEVHSRLGRFDTILMIGNNFGLFGGLKRARQLLRRFYKMTSPDARIIAESLDIYEPPIDPIHRQHLMRNHRRRRMPGQLPTRIRSRNYATHWLDHRPVPTPALI